MENGSVRNTVLPANAKDTLEACKVDSLKLSKMSLVDCPRFWAI